MSEDLDMLFESCQKGDSRAQEKVYKFFYPQLIKICYRYAGNQDEAGIIYNNSFLKIFKNSESYEYQGKLASWIKKIVIRTAIDYVRSKHLVDINTNYQAEIEDLEVSPSVINKLTADDIYQFLQSLPKATATVFNMFIYEEYQHKEIAEILNISEGTSKWHVSEARRLLKNKTKFFKI